LEGLGVGARRVGGVRKRVVRRMGIPRRRTGRLRRRTGRPVRRTGRLRRRTGRPVRRTGRLRRRTGRLRRRREDPCVAREDSDDAGEDRASHGKTQTTQGKTRAVAREFSGDAREFSGDAREDPCVAWEFSGDAREFPGDAREFSGDAEDFEHGAAACARDVAGGETGVRCLVGASRWRVASRWGPLRSSRLNATRPEIEAFLSHLANEPARPRITQNQALACCCSSMPSVLSVPLERLGRSRAPRAAHRVPNVVTQRRPRPCWARGPACRR